ncbi:thermonuclease family protein [Pseudovibrio sp. Tun.PSC04-5.I4]|uniref:thermonuclease family protein n=1 Tax=Pseudovibrio sp. Tun.PSC04-5.I4 TaxID=1798213 RepID=UPI001AD92CFB|nr:thermonuclease family protein [Pseudovibrio sp. Tun.PSC04-5.I4]
MLLSAAGFYALIDFYSDPALRGNARTLYRPSSFPVAVQKAETDLQQAQLGAAQLAAHKEAEAKIPTTPVKHPSALRNVGGTFTPAPEVSGPLQRIAHVKAPRKPAGPPPKELVLFHPVALDGATLSDKKRRIQLHHIQAVPLSTTCPSKAGDKWPCGIRARTALRAFIGQKRVTCADMKTEQQDELIATCSVGKHDLATWLVKNGWAKAGADAPRALKIIAEKARRSEQGIWRSKLVQLSEDETATLVNSLKELEDHSTSSTPLVMAGEPNIIWRPRETTEASTQIPQ